MDKSVYNLRVSGLFLVLPFIIEIPVLNANSADPDLMPLSAASDQGLQCLPVSHLWVKQFLFHLTYSEKSFRLIKDTFQYSVFMVISGHLRQNCPTGILNFMINFL